MNSETVSVKLFRPDAVSDIFGLVNTADDVSESQVAADLLASGVLAAEMLGWETSDIFSVISQQHPLAVKMADRIMEASDA